MSKNICSCGCGELCASWFVRGHNARLERKPRKVQTKHYRATNRGGRYVKLHRQRAERALGKPLPHSAVIHHADGSKSEHAPLVICQDQDYHKLLHVRMRIKRAGGDPNKDLVCTDCGLAKDRTAFSVDRRKWSGRQSLCRECARDRMHERRMGHAHAVV